MAKQVTAQYSFNLGQVNQSFYRRVDESYYWRAAKKLENVFVTSQGGVVKRPGSIQHTNLSDTIKGEGTPDFFTRYLYTPDNSMVRIAVLRVKNILHLGIYGQSIEFQKITLSAYTAQQAADLNYVVVRNSIILLNKEVAIHKIEYDGTNFTLTEFEFSKPATFDLGKVDYSIYTADITPGATTGDPTVIVLTGIEFPNPNTWLEGTIVGPGTNIDAPFGVGRIESVTVASGNTTFNVIASVAFAESSATTSYTGADLDIQQPIFNSQLGYPATGAYYQNRVWFTGHPAVPTTIFGTALGTQNNLGVGTGQPGDAIVYSSVVAGTGDFLYLTVGRHFEIFSENNELAVPNAGGVGLSPSNFSIKPQTAFRLLPTCEPITFQNYTFYAGNDGSSIYSFKQNMEGDEDTYESKNESVYCSDLINNPIKMVAFFGDAGSTIMLAVLNSNDTIAVFQLSDPLQIAAWTLYSVPHGTSLVTIDTDGTNLLLVKRYGESSEYILEELNIYSPCYVDSAIPVQIKAGETEVTGLETLNNFTVYAANEKEELGKYTVIDGKITLDTAPKSNFVGYVGLFYQSIVEPMDLDQIPGYNYTYKTVDKIYIDYVNSLAIEVNGIPVPYQYFSDLEEGNQLNLRSGTFEYFEQNGWQRFQTFQITQSKPVRMEIASLAYILSNAGR